MSARGRAKRQRVATTIERDAARARQSARLARAGAWRDVTPEDAERYARERLEDADIIERVHLTPPDSRKDPA